jgi:hypothetical protein
MDAMHGDLTLLNHPVAHELLHAAIPARVAYIALDGTPRVVPMQFHWTGRAIVLSCWPDDPKVAAMRAHPQVALTIDTEQAPFRVLQIRGRSVVEDVDGVPMEMIAASKRMLGPDAGQAFVDQAAQLSARITRIAVKPSWVDVLDFQTRFPSRLARRMAAHAMEMPV